jgi:hypothetical protein
MKTLATQVMRRFLSLKYVPKETKKSKAERLTRIIRNETGISKRHAESIADAIVRGRDLDALAIQKGWPLEEGEVVGPKGRVSLAKIQEAL